MPTIDWVGLWQTGGISAVAFVSLCIAGLIFALRYDRKTPDSHEDPVAKAVGVLSGEIKELRSEAAKGWVEVSKVSERLDAAVAHINRDIDDLRETRHRMKE